MNNESNPDIGLISGGLRLVVVGPEWASRFITLRYLKRNAANESKGGRSLYQRLKSSFIDAIEGSPSGA